MEIDRCERAWAAGFFDGEGWAARSGRGVQARINQAGPLEEPPEVLVTFRRIVGVGRIGGPSLKDGREPLWRWNASSRSDVGRVRELLLPWISEVKRDEFDTALGAGDLSSTTFLGSAVGEMRAWAAGLWDGEGWVGLTKHRSHDGYHALEAALTQSGDDGPPEVLLRLQQVAGVGRITGPFRQAGASRDVYRWKTYGVRQIAGVIELLSSWLGSVKRDQARIALKIVKAQAPLARGNPAWGAYKTHCVHGHEYATARIRPFRARHGGKQRRDSKQCLVCMREYARKKRLEEKRES